MEERPKVGIGVIVVKANKVLMGKRLNAHGEGTWCFPGGHLEFNEELEDAAKREVKEETNIDIKNVKFAAITNDIFKREGKHYITVFMKAEYDSGEIRINEPNKIVEFEWFEWNNLPSPLFLPNINLLKQGYNPFMS
jgi:8-oxo-dGTP diphosphatase